MNEERRRRGRIAALSPYLGLSLQAGHEPGRRRVCFSCCYATSLGEITFAYISFVAVISN